MNRLVFRLCRYTIMCPIPLRYFTGCVFRNWSTSNCRSWHIVCYTAWRWRIKSTRSGIRPARSSPSVVIMYISPARPVISSVNHRPSLISCYSLHRLEYFTSVLLTVVVLGTGTCTGAWTAGTDTGTGTCQKVLVAKTKPFSAVIDTLWHLYSETLSV